MFTAFYLKDGFIKEPWIKWSNVSPLSDVYQTEEPYLIKKKKKKAQIKTVQSKTYLGAGKGIELLII